MKFWHILLLFFIVAILSLGIYDLLLKSRAFEKEAAELRNSFKKMSEENKELISKIEYYKQPENLLKELKSQFNYVESGEKLIIVVPKKRD